MHTIGRKHTHRSYVKSVQITFSIRSFNHLITSCPKLVQSCISSVLSLTGVVSPAEAEEGPAVPEPAVAPAVDEDDEAKDEEPLSGFLASTIWTSLTAHSLCALQFLIPRTSSPGHAHASNWCISSPGGPSAVKSGSSGVPPMCKLFKWVISPKSVFHDIMTPPGPK